MHRVTNHCDAQTEFFEWTSLQPFHGGDVVTCFDVVGCRERWSTAVGCEVTWGEVMWLVARCHVMSCDVIWCVFMLCDAISCVVWCHVIHCDVMWCPLMWWAVICCEVMRCNGMRSYEFVMRCGCGWLRCHVVWFEVVVWGELGDDLVIRTTQIYSVLHSTTKYYSGTTLYYTVLLRYYSVLQSTTPVLLCTAIALQSTTPVLLCTTKYYSSTTPYYKVLLQYYSVLQSTTPVLLCTTKYYSSTSLYCKSTTPVLLCSTQYYSSTTLYYKVLLQYYSVLHRSTPVLLRTTQIYSSTAQIYSSTSLYNKVLLQYYKILLQDYSVLQSTTPVLLQHYTVLQSTTPVLLCTTKYYSGTTPCYYKVCICKARSTNVTNVTKCCACHAKWLSWLILVTYETSFTMRRATGLILQRHQILHLPRKMTLMSDVRHIWNLIYNARSNSTHPPTSPNTVPATQNDSHEWCPSHLKRHLHCAEQQDSSSNVIKYCTCHAKWLSWVMSVTYETSFTMRGATSLALQPHQMLRLPRKVTRMIDPRDIWNVIYNARNNRHHPPTSPNTAPATQNCIPKSKKNLPKTVKASIPMRGRFDHDPTMIRPWSDHELVISHPPVRRGYFWRFGDAFCIENYNISRSGYLPRFHQILRLPQKVTLMSDVRHIWNVIYNARSNRTHPPTSPNTAPATQNDSHEWCPSHMKRHLQCAEQQVSPSNLTKCCACHEKWHAWLILVTYETSFTMRGTTGITLQPHQILRLPRKIVFQNLRKICRKQLKRQFQCAADSTMIRPWSDHDPTMIRPWSDHELVISHPPVRRGYFWRFGDAFCIENYNISRSGYLPRFHQILCLPRKVTLQHHQMLRLPRKVTLQHHQILPLPRKVALQDHQMLRLPWKVTLNCYLTALLLVIWRELWLY